MTDFLATLAGQILGAAPEVGPLLPPRFAPWPGIPRADVTPRPRADGVLFPPPLIDPTGQDVGAPLPTLRQMSEIRPASGGGIMPPQQPAVERPETGPFQAGDLSLAEAASFPPAVDHRPPGVLPAAPSPSPVSPVAGDESLTPVMQVRADSGARGGGAVLPALTAAIEMAAAENERGLVPPSPVLAPSPLAAEPIAPPSQLIQRPPEPAGPSLDEPVQVRPQPGDPQAQLAEVPSAAAPVIAMERQRLPVQSAASGKHHHEYSRRQSPADQQEVASPPRDGGSQGRVSDSGASRGGQTRNDNERWSIERLDSGTAVVKSVQLVQQQPKSIKGHAKPIQSQPELVQALREPKARTAETPMQPVTRTLASAQLAVQLAAPMPAPMAQRVAAPGGPPVAPLAHTPLPATAPDLSVSTRVRVTPTTTGSALSSASPEPAPRSDRALGHSREPSIVPAPGPAPGEEWPTTQAGAATSLRQPWGRPTAGESEPPPTVRVTIGRVVVRASPADERPTARRVELPLPPVSLDEYLRGRQEGGR